jgi:hypothetical protein
MSEESVMKTVEEMTFDERIAWAKGVILLGIGEGKFQESVYTVVSLVTQEAYYRGRKEMRDEANKEIDIIRDN